MSECRHTGLSVPECSCRPCLEAQLAEHQPAQLTHPAQASEAAPALPQPDTSQPERPAA